MCTQTHLDCSCFISASLAAWKRESTFVTSPRPVMQVQPFLQHPGAEDNTGIVLTQCKSTCLSSVTPSPPPTPLKQTCNLQVSVFLCLPHLSCLQQSFNGFDPF